MSCVRATQFITEDGKIQIDVVNTSGHAQPPSRGPTPSNRLSGPADPDEPCSLIVSLRASHPQLFFFRGAQAKATTSNTVASPLRLLGGNNNSNSNGGGGGGNGNGSIGNGGGGVGPGGRHHRRVGSALWGGEPVDSTILDVSRRTWREHNFPNIAAEPPRASTGSADRSRELSSTALPHSESATAVQSDSRPLLVREELADCVLLPGERRTFVIEVSNPAALAKMLAMTHQPSPTSSAWRQAPQHTRLPSFASQGSEHRSAGDGGGAVHPLPEVINVRDGRHNTGSSGGGGGGGAAADTANFPIRAVTDVFRMDASATHNASGQHATRHSVRGPTTRDSSSLYSDSPADSVSGGRTDERSRDGPMKHEATRPGEWGGGGRRRREGGGDDDSYSDEDSRSPSQQPLSIVVDSSTTRNSAQLDSASQQQGERRSGGPQHHHELQQQQQQHDSLHSSRDYVVPPSSSSASIYDSANHRNMAHSSSNSNLPPHLTNHSNNNNSSGNGAAGGNGGRPNHRVTPLSPQPAVAGEAAHHYAPPSLSKRPAFFLYFHPLGDEDRCVDRARKWIAKEEDAYHRWRETVVHTVVDHERRRERQWRVAEAAAGGRAVLPPQPRLEARRILPPALGEPVRWREEGGCGADNSDPLQLSSITVSAFHYYYASAQSEKVKAGSGSAASTPTKHVVLAVPPPFTATRANLVSKKARKLFKGNRQRAGTVVLPLRVPDAAESVSPVQREPRRKTAATATSPTAAGAGAGGGGVGNAPSGRTIPAPAAYLVELPGSTQLHTPGRGVSPLSEPAMAASATPGGLMQPYRGGRPQHSHDETDSNGYLAASGTASEQARSDSHLHRPRFRTGRGLALLDEPVTGPPTPSAGCTTEAGQTSGDYAASQTESRQSFLAASGSHMNSRWSRVETLDPEAAELAALNPMPPRTSTYEKTPLADTANSSLSDAKPALPSFPATLEGSSGPASPFSATSRRFANSGSSSHLAGQLADEHHSSAAAVAAAAAVMRLTDTTGGGEEGEAGNGSNSGSGQSFVATLIQSFCGLRGDNGTTGNGVGPSGYTADSDSGSPHIRDISSAPPERVTYRRRATNVSNGSTLGNVSFNISPGASGRWLAGQSKVASTQVAVAAQQLSEKAGAAAVQAADLIQQHGPTAWEGVTTVLGFLKDVVFTPDNVAMMETVITPMVVVFSVIALTYIMLLGGGGAGEALPLLYSGNL